MIRSAIGFVVALGLIVPVTWGWGKYQYFQGKRELVCVSNQKKVPRKSPENPLNGIPFPFDMILNGVVKQIIGNIF